ncbi:hypothetical protein THC_1715 [Caldimicrobium thiodismutans]|uniref:Magnetosome protein MamS/MamX domain-containing protein n=1 Tax=Caldimicrobium thiodismutans TaxID=1653476 RepID=A0A0U4W4U7_9BACT|nr:hypothetical protein [Caldimicrobium thiodismutans]BAU24075.1 hypothetical protein THC_1715 [Caldimicrobium thiodismutans]
MFKIFKWGGIFPLFLSIMILFFSIPEVAFSQEDFPEMDLENYDPNTEIVLKGEIREIIIPKKPKKKKGMVRLLVAKGDKIYTVFLSPWWFYFKLNPNLKIGDRVEIKGAKIYTRKHGLALVVKTLKNLSTGEELILRDTTCKPCWSGGRN